LIYNKKDREYKVVIKQPIVPTILILIVMVVGTVGYYFIWEDKGVTILDSLYMVIITITTIGYQEVFPLDTPISKIFTMLISLFGISSLFYLFSNIMENLFLLQTMNIRGRKKMKNYLDEVNNHYIIVGYGRVGRLAAHELMERKKEFIVIDPKVTEEKIKEKESEFKIIQGDATEDEVLKLAGIERAKSIIVATAKAEVTVFVVLSAKELNPKLNIVARADDEANIVKLKKAGATKVVNPYAAGGYKLASLAANTSIIDFFDANFSSQDGAFDIERLVLDSESKWIGKSLKELDVRKKCGASIIGVVRDDNTMINPLGDFVFKELDHVVVVGNHQQLLELERYIK